MRASAHPHVTNLEHLLRERPFEALSLQERAQVLTEMSAEEYRRVREVALLAEQYLGEDASGIAPRPDIQAHLRQRLRARYRWQSRVQQLLDYRMPVWQAAAAAALLVFTLHWASEPSLSHATTMQKAQFADSTFHDSALHRAADLSEDTAYLRLGRGSDTL